jgi:conjugative transfer pilus assembly protein TraH
MNNFNFFAVKLEKEKKAEFSLRIRIIILLFFSSFICLQSVFANVGSDLNNFFDGLGFSANITNPTAYQGQQAGYYSGGSIFERNTVRDFQLASVDLPSFRGGCGGIDLFTGGFSFINSKQLQAALKNIANNGVNYAFMLAIKSVSPLIANTMEDLQSWANKINNMNINSCETGAALVGSLWPKTDVAQQNVCESIGTESGIFGDWAAARQGCGDGGQRSDVLNRGLQEKEFKDLVLKDTNIAWQAILKNGFLAGDSNLAELFMSLSGTIIVRNNGGDKGSNTFITLPSLANNRQLLKALLYGGTAKIYHCDSTDKCLAPTSDYTITINKSEALESKVHDLLKNMVQHIYDDTPLTKEEIGLLQATPLPVYKMLNVQSAYVGDPAILDISQYSDVIASSILYQYIQENLDVVKRSASVLQYPQEILDKFQKGIDRARSEIETLRVDNYTRMNQTFALIQRTQLLEQQLLGQLSAKMGNNIKWADSMR